MATYNNLTSLEGLQVGDTITYDTNTTIDFKGYTVTVKLNSSGLAKADINTKLFPNTILTYSTDAGHCLCYGNTLDLYTRIMVAGDAGDSAGGGLVGGGGSAGGTQTAGGTKTFYGNGADGYCRNGSFGYGGSGDTSKGGNGWYGGGGSYDMLYQITGELNVRSGGGSGFVLGLEGTAYPSGYLSDDTTLIDTLKSAITNGVLTQGGGRGVKMEVTILALPNSSSTRNIHYYNGTQFVEAEVYRYNGTLFERVEPKIYTNSQWQ